MCVFLFQCRILWLDEKNLTARCESGIVGQDLERLVKMNHSILLPLILTITHNNISLTFFISSWQRRDTVPDMSLIVWSSVRWEVG